MRIGKKGFTLVEVIVSLAIMTIVAGSIGAFIIAGNNSYLRGNKELTLQEEAQLAANQMIDLIIDVEKDINFTPDHTGTAVNIDGSTAKDEAGNEITTAHVSELRLVNNENTYMIRWQGSAASDYEAANQVYLYEVKNTTDADGNLVVGDPATATPALMAEHASNFNVDLSQVKDKRKVILNMTFTYQDKSYDISETIKLRNDLEKTGTAYAWISALTIDPPHVSVKQGQAFAFKYTLSGDDEAVAQGVTWSVSYADGSTCKSFVDTNGKLTVAADENIGENVLIVTCTSVADSSKYATATVTVEKHLVDSLQISPTFANVMQSKTQQFTYTMEGSEEAKKAGVTWSVERIDGKTLSVGTIVNTSGLLNVGRYEAIGKQVLRVTCASVEDPAMTSSALVTVLEYSNIDGKYDAKLIAETLTTYKFEEDGVPKVGYKGNIECLPSWADYLNGYPKIEWSVLEDPEQNKFSIESNEGPNESQFTATLKCRNQTSANYPDGINVQAKVQLSADVEVILGITIKLPNLKTAVVSGAPYIDSNQFVLNRNDKITCTIKNYTDENNNPLPVKWKISDMPEGLYSMCTHPDQKVTYRNNMVGLEERNSATWTEERPINDTWDADHHTYELLMEHTGIQTSVIAKYYINTNEEYRFTLQAWSLDETELIADTVILVPKFDIMFSNGEHVRTVNIPDWNINYNLKFYGYTTTSEANMKDWNGSQRGYHVLDIDGYLQGENKLQNAELYTEGLDESIPRVRMAITEPQNNDYLIMTFWDKEHPDNKRNLLLLIKKK